MCRSRRNADRTHPSFHCLNPAGWVDGTGVLAIGVRSMLGAEQIARGDTEVGPPLERTRFGLGVKSGDADKECISAGP